MAACSAWSSPGSLRRVASARGGFEPVQQQMVLQYVEKHGSIGRGEAAELCRLSLSQAYRLLQLLVQKGLIEKPPGRGRGIRYTRKEQ